MAKATVSKKAARVPRDPCSEGETGRRAPCGQYRVACAESAVRRLLVRLAEDDALFQRLKLQSREVLAEAGIELPRSVEVDLAAFDRRRIRRMATTTGPLLNLTLGGHPMLRVKGRPSAK